MLSHTPNHTAKYLQDYQSPACSVSHTNLSFTLDEQATQVTARLTVTMQRKTDLQLDGTSLRLHSIAINNTHITSADYLLDDQSLIIPCSVWQEFGISFVLTTVVEITPTDNTELMGLYTSGGLLCTQCEPEGFRRITYYPDRPDVLSQFTVCLTADKHRYPVLLAGGNKTDHSLYPDNNTHSATFIDPHPKPSYLFALVAGDLTHLETRHITSSGKEVTVQVHSTRNNAHKLQFALDVIGRAMRWDESMYGCEYDLDCFHVVAADDFNSGAMENKGLNIFNAEALLAHPETTTDMQYMRIEAIIAHEYFHNWSGNRVTCRDWFQLSLKEGFTVFREAQYIAETYSHALRRIEDASFIRTYQFAEDAGGLAHPVRPPSYEEISNFYTATVYEKGAEVLHMLSLLVGQEAFNTGCRLYFARHDGQAATIENFITAIADKSGVDLTQFMRWYDQAGTPHIKIGVQYDANTQQLTLDVAQSCRPTVASPEPQPFVIPLPFELLDEQGNQLYAGSVVVNQARQQFVIESVVARPVVSAFSDFAAPVTWHVEQLLDTQDANSIIAAHADDLFAQWNSSRILLHEAITTGDMYHIMPCFTAWLKQASAHPTDATVVCDFFALPTVRELLNENSQQKQGVLALCNKRRVLSSHIAHHLSEQWLALYNQCRTALYGQTPDRKTHKLKAQVSLRALMNSALGYLLAHPSGEFAELARNQYDQSQTMTERLQALRLLIDYQLNGYQERLFDMFTRFEQDAIVLGQWFRLQAGSRHVTPTMLEQLFNHPCFSWKSPNLLRATLGAYVANLEAYHAAPENYAYITQKIAYVDTLNNKIAARLATECTKWQGLDATRKMHMQQALRAIAEDASVGLREVIEKAVAQAD